MLKDIKKDRFAFAFASSFPPPSLCAVVAAVSVQRRKYREAKVDMSGEKLAEYLRWVRGWVTADEFAEYSDVLRECKYCHNEDKTILTIEADISKARHRLFCRDVMRRLHFLGEPPLEGIVDSEGKFCRTRGAKIRTPSGACTLGVGDMVAFALPGGGEGGGGGKEDEDEDEDEELIPDLIEWLP